MTVLQSQASAVGGLIIPGVKTLILMKLQNQNKLIGSTCQSRQFLTQTGNSLILLVLSAGG